MREALSHDPSPNVKQYFPRAVRNFAFDFLRYRIYRMYSTEQRRVAIEAFIKFDHNYADAIAELGYPNRYTPNNWWREYKTAGEFPIAKIYSRLGAPRGLYLPAAHAMVLARRTEAITSLGRF